MPPSSIIDADLAEWTPKPYFVLESGSIWKATGYGGGAATWEEVWTSAANFSGDTFGALLRVRCATTSGLLYAIGYGVETSGGNNKPFCLRSTNSGLSWVQTWIDEDLTTRAYTVDKAYATMVRAGGQVYTSATHHWNAAYAGETYNPWALAFSYSLTGTNNLGMSHSEDAGVTMHAFSGSGASSANTVYGTGNFLLGSSGAPGEVYLDDYFGSSGWTAIGGINLDMYSSATRITQRLFSDQIVGTAYIVSYAFWKYPSVIGAKAFDVARSNNNWLYLGLGEKIIKSEDGGFTWADWYTTEGANDILVDPQAAGAVYAWDTAAQLVLIVSTAVSGTGILQATIATETSAWDQYGRIARQLNGGILWFLNASGALYKRENATNTSLVTGIFSGRSLKTFLGGTGAKLVYLSGPNVHYSSDAGANWSLKKGGWTSYANPVSIHLLE